MTSPYECNDHKLNIVCLGCVIAKNRKYEVLLDFVKKIITGEAGYANVIDLEAEELLKKIGELT